MPEYVEKQLETRFLEWHDWTKPNSLHPHISFLYAIFLSLVIVIIVIYGSVSAGREFWPFRVIFFQKVERSCGQTVKDIFDFSIDSGQLYLVHSGDLNLALDNKEEEEEGGNNDEEKEEDKTNSSEMRAWMLRGDVPVQITTELFVQLYK